ncbi:MAG: DUF1460 domain-containing protein [Prevotella sp.]|nr:DUF1460 domain-containing protein [Prevotella sp.]
MKHLFIIAALLMASVTMKGQTALAKDSICIEKLLQSGDTTTLYYARKFLGRPYVSYTLEVNDEEQLVVNTRQLDCTTLVETVAALVLCAKDSLTTFADFKSKLQQLRYRGGVIDGYPSRLHYFSDWIIDNTAMGFVREVQQEGLPFSSEKSLYIKFMSRYIHAYKTLQKHPEFIPTIAAQEDSLTGYKYRFIPKAQVKNSAALRAVVKDGDILAITCSTQGLDVSHLGFAVWKADGLHLLNASSIHKKVVDEPMTLRQYLYKHPKFTGIRVVRMM